MPSHLRNGRDLSYEQRQRALEYQLSPAGAARLQRLGGQSATPGRRITIVGPGRTASGSRDKSGLDQLERDVPSSRIEQRDVSAAGIHQVHASTATSGQGELPSNPPTDPDFGADRHSSSSYSAHSDPLNGSRKFDGYYTRASGPEFLGNNSQQSMGNVNPRDDPEQSRPRGNDPTQSGLERPEELAALDAPSRPQNIPMPNQGLHPAHHMAGSLPVLNNNNAGMPPPPPAVGVLDESIYATPASFIAPSVPALSATGPDGPRLRTSTPLSPKRLRNQPVPTPSSRKLERIREEQEKTPERDSRSAQDGPIFHARQGRDGTHPRARQIRTPRQPHQTQNPPPAPR
ncbi:hypothetical protein H4Q26_016340 [Puccinia striiformis f. sp. tritici PST-130]|nr:hypothetical protein H4Q26_016340 [Puccinia striiformis f. sp. tritici PST-130]